MNKQPLYGLWSRCPFVMPDSAVLISVPIMLSRMVLGDHYLSDVAFGAIAGLKMCYSVEKVGDKAENFSLRSVKKKL